jgi:hypothetical protein
LKEGQDQQPNLIESFEKGAASLAPTLWNPTFKAQTVHIINSSD